MADTEDQMLRQELRRVMNVYKETCREAKSAKIMQQELSQTLNIEEASRVATVASEENVENEMRRLQQELDEAINTYNEACREVMTELSERNYRMANLDTQSLLIHCDIARLSQSAENNTEHLSQSIHAMLAHLNEMRVRVSEMRVHQHAIVHRHDEISQNLRQTKTLLLAGLVLIVSLGMIISKEVSALKNNLKH